VSLCVLAIDGPIETTNQGQLPFSTGQLLVSNGIHRSGARNYDYRLLV